MDLSARILGKHAVEQLLDRASSAVLVIGSDRFTRADLAGVACFNFIAAANLSAQLAVIGVKSTRDVFERISPAMLAVPRIGAISLAVLGAAFERKGLGGDHPLEAWVTRHRGETDHRKLVTFDTLKHHSADMRAEQRERQSRQARTRGRRQQAHRLRVDRFTKRQKSRP